MLVEEWKEQCPLLHDIIWRLTTTSSTSRCTVQTTASRLQDGVLLLSSLCYVQSQTHNTIPHFLGLFLHSCGVQRTALDALHAIGLTSPYSTLLKWTNNYTLSRDLAAEVPVGSILMIIFDNYNRSVNRQHWRIDGDISNLTTDCIAQLVCVLHVDPAWQSLDYRRHRSKVISVDDFRPYEPLRFLSGLAYALIP